MESIDYSTNNAWGFGGSCGTEYRFESGWRVRHGTLCYRHGPCGKTVYAIDPAGQRYLDLQLEGALKSVELPAEVSDLVRSLNPRA